MQPNVICRVLDEDTLLSKQLQCHQCKELLQHKLRNKIFLQYAGMADNLTNGNIHTIVSSTPTLLYLASGAAKVEELQPVLAVGSLRINQSLLVQALWVFAVCRNGMLGIYFQGGGSFGGIRVSYFGAGSGCKIIIYSYQSSLVWKLVSRFSSVISRVFLVNGFY